jgi:hypothetical protein
MGDRVISRRDVMEYASPLNQVIGVFIALLFCHALVTMIFFLMTISDDVVLEFYFIASKSCHVFLPFLGTFYAVVAYQKSDLYLTRKLDYMDFRLFLVLGVATTLLVVDCVFFGKDTVPTVRSCYEDPLPPVYCDTNGRKIAYVAGVGLRAGHIVLEALILLFALVVRWTDTGDCMYEETSTIDSRIDYHKKL